MLPLKASAMSSWAEESEAVEEASAVAGEAELVDGGAEDEEDAGEEGFGFGHGYDFGAAARRESLFEAISDEAAPGVAIETDVGEVGSEG